MRSASIAGGLLAVMAVMATEAGVLPTAVRAESPGKTRVYFGTYTGGKSQGIYRSSWTWPAARSRHRCSPARR